MPKIIEIPGRSGFYLRVAVPRGKLRDAFGTCDVVKKIGNTKEEAEENISSAEIAIQQKFDEKLREEDAKQINKSLPKGIRLEAIKNSNSKDPQKIHQILENTQISCKIAAKSRQTLPRSSTISRNGAGMLPRPLSDPPKSLQNPSKIEDSWHESFLGGEKQRFMA